MKFVAGQLAFWLGVLAQLLSVDHNPVLDLRMSSLLFAVSLYQIRRGFRSLPK